MGLFDDFFSSKDQAVSSTGPWLPQQPFIKKGFRRANKWYKSGGPQFYEGDLTVDRNPLELSSENALMDYAGGDKIQGLLDSGHQATGDMLGGGYFGYAPLLDDPNVGSAYQRMLSGDPFQNPYLKQTADAADADMMESFNRNVRPAISDNMVFSGQHGGSSRGDLMNQRAIDDLTENMSQNRTNLYGRAYNDALNRQGQGLSLAEGARSGIGRENINRYGQGMSQMPNLYDLQKDTLGLPGRVGLTRRDYDQQLRDDDIERWNYNQNLPLSNLQNYMNLISGNYGSQTNQSRESRDSDYDITKGLISDVGGIASFAAGFSDRRLKTNIRKIGKLPNGLNVYTFNYIWGGPEETGVMADEVKRIMPNAVSTVDGYDVVDYGMIMP